MNIVGITGDQEMSTFHGKKAIYIAASLAAAAWLPTDAYAQTQQAVSGAIEEVLVTARRREESLQDVPIAISAFGGENLQARGVETVANMNAVAPNLSVMGGQNSGESQASFRVRGMPGVSVYVDGINQESTDGLLTLGVVEVDRIEVLRGPQGTLFGNASLGGAVSYVTRAPAGVYGARVQGSVGSYNRRDFQAAVDMPFSDSFKSKFTVASMSRDGFVDSVVTERSYGDVNDELARADFLWKPIDSLSLRYNVEKSDTDRVGPARVVWEVGPKRTLQAGSTTYNTNPNAQVYQNANGYDYSTANTASGQGGVLDDYETKIAWETNGLVIDLMRHTMDIGWDINDTFRVRSLTGYKEIARGVQVDFDGDANVILLERDNRITRRDFSQELQLLGSHERVDWVVGAYFSEAKQRARTVTWAMPEFTCDLWNAANLQRVTTAERTQCFENRKRALGVTNPAITTNAQLTALAPNLNGVTLATFSGAASSNADQMNLTNPQTQAFFGDVTFRVTDQFTVAAGLRYSEDTNPNTVSLQNNSVLASRGTLLPDNNIPNYFGFFGTPPSPTGESKYDALTTRLTLQYQWSPDVMTYIGYADGYGPGGQSNTPGSVTSYMASIENGLTSDIPATVFRDEQTVKSYEVGLRADWLGGALRTNVTAFYTDWQNVEVNQYVATQYWDTNGNNRPDSTINVDGVPGNDIFFYPGLWSVAAAKAIAQGLEFESTWRATDSLRIDFNFGWLDTEYKELGQAGEGVAPAISTGSRFAGAPEYTANISAQYEFAMEGGAVIVPRLDYTFTDDYTLQTGEVAQRVQEGFGLFNARLAYNSGSNWNVALSGTNLTKEYYFNSGFFTRAEQIHFMTVGRPREWGLTFNWNFE